MMPSSKINPKMVPMKKIATVKVFKLLSEYISLKNSSLLGVKYIHVKLFIRTQALDWAFSDGDEAKRYPQVR